MTPETPDRADEYGIVGGGGIEILAGRPSLFRENLRYVGKAAPKVSAVLAETLRKSRRGTRSSVIRASLPLSRVGIRVGSRLARLGGDGNDRRGSFMACIGAFVRANLPSGLLKPRRSAFVLYLRPSLLLFAAF